jgi:hypothetical protein
MYGVFCQPECAVAYLMHEHIDDSMKFERYAILNSFYKKQCKYTTNIKSAINPYYVLDKYCGNLTINEYRHINEDYINAMELAPFIHTLPDNIDLPIHNYDFKNNSQLDKSKHAKIYKVKKHVENPVSKTHILNNQFGLGSGGNSN